MGFECAEAGIEVFDGALGCATVIVDGPVQERELISVMDAPPKPAA